MKRIITLFAILVSAMIAPAQNTGISPTPQQVHFAGGNGFVWDDVSLQIAATCADRTLIETQYEELTGAKPLIPNKKNRTRRTIRLLKVRHLDNVPQWEEQAYQIAVDENNIVVSATTDQGLFYGWQSLKQLYRYHYRLYFTEDENVVIPCMAITDYPALQWRGWMDDISRGPIATMDFIKGQIRLLSEFKLNCLSLYTENTFQSTQYDFAPQNSLTAAEIQELDAYAKQYHIELIGNQQCFAHLDKILTLPQFSHLADTKYNLNPALPETYTFLQNLLSEEAKAYSSPWFNINCDETEALGTGAAADYVRKVGKGEAYAQHILKVHDIIKKNKKRTMMWADILLKDSIIQHILPKDITMMVWSYVPSDSFMGMINPVREAGFDFWVVPGVSMWSTVFPDMLSYEKNIANFARDGAATGAQGLLNTCWNDSGEALLNSAWHALCWGAEMSWKPIVNQEVEKSEAERAQRIAIFDTCFNFQFFHFYNNENIIADFLRATAKFRQSPVTEIYNTGSLWRFQPLQFLPGNLSEESLQDIKNERFDASRNIELLRLILSEEAQYQNPEIIYCALLATNRLFNNLNLKRFQFYLYDDYLHPEKITPDEIENVHRDINDHLFFLEELKKGYHYLWDLEYRPYWKDAIDKKYHSLSQQITTIPQEVFITQQLNPEGKPSVVLRTLLGNIPIHYTLNGTVPDQSSPLFTYPIEVQHSCTVKTVTLDISGKEKRNEKEILVHKGMGHCTEVDGKCSEYRPEYSGGGKFALADGELGSDDYRDGKWQGYQDQDVVLHYNFSQIAKNEVKTTHISQITIEYLQNFYDWILAPQDVTLTYTNGKTEISIPTYHFEIEQITGSKVGKLILRDLDIDCERLSIRIHNPGPLPEPHGAAGAPSFIFLDEIIIE